MRKPSGSATGDAARAAEHAISIAAAAPTQRTTSRAVARFRSALIALATFMQKTPGFATPFQAIQLG
jgi:hypothetical protein